MNKKGLKLVGLLFGFAMVMNAAPPPPSTSTPPCWPPPCIPIDGGITLLMVAGAAYGAKKLYNSRQKKESVD